MEFSFSISNNLNLSEFFIPSDISLVLIVLSNVVFLPLFSIDQESLAQSDYHPLIPEFTRSSLSRDHASDLYSSGSAPPPFTLPDSAYTTGCLKFTAFAYIRTPSNSSFHLAIPTPSVPAFSYFLEFEKFKFYFLTSRFLEVADLS